MTNTTITTATEARKMKLAELQAVATQLGIEINHSIETETNDNNTIVVEIQEVPKKKQTLLAEILEQLSKTRNRETNDVRLTDEMQAIIDGDITREVKGQATEHKSEKMRQLYDLGMPTAQIARTLDVHYSYVYGTIKRHLMPKVAKPAVEIKNLPTAKVEEAKAEVKKPTRQRKPSKKAAAAAEAAMADLAAEFGDELV